MGGALEGVVVKLGRAEAHTRDLNALLAPLVDIATKSIVREIDGDPSKLLYRVTEVPAFEPGVSAIIGDAFSNLRSALDHLAWRLVELDGGVPCEHTQFPVYASRLSKKGHPRVVTIQPQILRADILNALEAVQPYNRGNPWDDTLWIVRELRNIDTHRLLLVIACAVEAEAAWWSLPAGVPSPAPRISLKPLERGDPIAWFNFGQHDAPHDFDPHLSIAVGLNEGPIGCWIRRQHAADLLHELHRSLVAMLNWRFVPLFPGEPPFRYPAPLWS